MSIQKYATILAITTIAMFTTGRSYGQIVSFTERAKEANVKIFVTPYMMDADVVVFKTPFLNNSIGNKGQWYVTGNPGEAMKKIYIIKHKEESDLKVYFTTNSAEAGWKNKKKRYMMN